VATRVEEALDSWLSPATFGSPPERESPLWARQTKVRLSEAVDIVNRVDGVHYVSGPTTSPTGLPELNGAAADIDLSGLGPVVLPLPGAHTVTVTAP
jgi:hypothetical protein